MSLESVKCRGEKRKSKRVDFTRLGREKEISPMPTGEREELSPTGKSEMSPLEREKEISLTGERKETSPVPTGLPAVVSEVGERCRLEIMGREGGREAQREGRVK